MLGAITLLCYWFCWFRLFIILFCLGWFFLVCIQHLKKWNLKIKGWSYVGGEIDGSSNAVAVLFICHDRSTWRQPFPDSLHPMIENSTLWDQETALISNMLHDGFHCTCLHLHLSFRLLLWCKPLFHHCSHYSDWTKPTGSPPWMKLKHKLCHSSIKQPDLIPKPLLVPGDIPGARTLWTQGPSAHTMDLLLLC